MSRLSYNFKEVKFDRFPISGGISPEIPERWKYMRSNVPDRLKSTDGLSHVSCAIFGDKANESILMGQLLNSCGSGPINSGLPDKFRCHKFVKFPISGGTGPIKSGLSAS